MKVVQEGVMEKVFSRVKQKNPMQLIILRREEKVRDL